MIRRQVLTWRVHVHQIRIYHHGYRFKDPEAPFRGIGVGCGRVEECRGAKGVAQQDENTGDVERVDDDFDVVSENGTSDTANVKDYHESDEGEKEGYLQQ